MNKRIFLLTSTILLTQPLYAGTIIEVESNSTLFTAQNIDGTFSSGLNDDIYNANELDWEWSSIVSLDGDGTYDYYSFTALANQNYIFDIDYGMPNLDAEIGLWSISDTTSALLADQDDSCVENGVSFCSIVDIGSVHSYDPKFSWESSSSGLYVIGVARYPTSATDSGFNGSAPISGDDYTLQVSRDLAVSVPAPAGVMLFVLSLMGFAATRKVKK